jgi:hypothetical protein
MTAVPEGNGCYAPEKSSEQILVDLIREDLGVHINPQAARLFVRTRWDRLHAILHRIHEGRR